MFAKPQAEHHWLAALNGEWTSISECVTGPGEPPSKTEGKVSIRSLGGMWMVAEMVGPSMEGGTWTSIMTLGYDIKSQKYVGTFVGEMMDFMWVYNGSVDESGRKLVLNATGPKFDGSGFGEYRDSIEIRDADHWVLTSHMKQEDGTWTQFMEAHHTRVK